MTFPVGQTSRTVTVATLQDMISEGTEEFTATLSNPVGGNFIVGSTGSATISIVDDDGRYIAQSLVGSTNVHISLVFYTDSIMVLLACSGECAV